MENKRESKKKKNKRKKQTNKKFILGLICIILVVCAGAVSLFFILRDVFKEKEEVINKEIKTNVYSEGFSVTYLNVGYGDSSIIKFPSGKVLMIDTGSKTDRNYNLIIETLEKLSVESIDYLVLTHPHSDHIGNTIKILENKSVGKLFIPKTYEYNLFSELNEIVVKAKELNIETEISCVGEIEDVDAKIFFLAPREADNSKSAYQGLIGENNPSDLLTDNLSSVIYIEYKGIRFLFSGDGGKSVEDTVKDLYNVKLYDDSVVLESIDFYKVSNHGKSNANTQNYLNLLLTKNAIISTGNDEYGSLEVINRLNIANENVRILKTDTDGNVIVLVDKSGKTQIITEND